MTSPSYSTFTADGYFDIAGEIKYTGNLQYAYVIVELDWTSFKTTYWFNKTFSKKIWLRYGKGNYTIKVCKAQISNGNTIVTPYDGDILGWSYYSPAIYTFKVTNTRDEDGRFIYPSEYIQSDSAEIYNLTLQKLIAANMLNGTVQQKARVLHDYVVKSYYYDLDSLNAGKRKKQDAITTLTNGCCVCEGYTSIYNAMLRSIGIPAKAIVGLGNGGSHAWSNVYDGSSWKFVDTTWDDPLYNGHSNYPTGTNLVTTYFWLDGNSGVGNDHVWQGDREERGIETNEDYLFINAKEGTY